ncbi:MAG: hypothetical protein AAFO69_09220 [Bacteroidota bacterium]
MKIKERKLQLEELYNGSAFTDTWNTGVVDLMAAREAIEYMKKYIDMCDQHDIRTDNFFAALHYVGDYVGRRSLVSQMHNALEIQNPEQRKYRAKLVANKLFTCLSRR